MMFSSNPLKTESSSVQFEYNIEKQFNPADTYFPYKLCIHFKFDSEISQRYVLTHLESALKKLEGNYHRS